MRRKSKKKYRNTPKKIDVDNLVIDTTRRERFQVFEILASMRKLLICVLVFSGLLSMFFSVQSLMGSKLFASSNFIVLIAVGFIGVTNIICGLLLLASE